MYERLLTIDRLTDDDESGRMHHSVMTSTTRILTLACAVGAGTAAGAFLTFSTFTMAGLERLRPSEGAAAMQSINRQATTPVFMLVLFGTGAACVVLGIQSARHLDEPFAWHRLVACAVYLVGVVVLTVAYHVPRNDMLDGFDPNSPEGIAYWHTYVRQWKPMNHVRTIAPLVSSVLLGLSLQAA